MSSPRLIAALVVCAAAFSPIAAQAQACDLPGNMAQLRTEVVANVNAERTARGLPALRLNAELVKAAQSLACDNAKRQGVSHVSTDGSRLQDRLRRAGYSFSMANENTGRGFASSQIAVNWWMNSPDHRANILMRGTQDIGVGIAFSDAPESRLHWVIDMGATR